ncbi:membrane protein insertion efficiency factor YidD [Chlamydiifrater phoenicopteri]|uniref:membrane protein insertion efficiency factor YidD n=1 Tax=Chlamydiifrater phoenicopteri TaxID=2681469 RepID=UPI001BD1026B|nr:membrane protein insertion efficiency factor YidD [Chlamydiifrater phoenicopteri]
MKKFLTTTIKAYRLFLSPFFGQSCRFFPSCSFYALQALHHYKTRKALWLISCRIVKCCGWHPGGPDFLPGTSVEEALQQEPPL